MKNIREEYVKHMEKMFGFLGDQPDVAKANAEKVMQIETELAKSQRSRVDLRDPYKNYNKKSIADLTNETGIDWKGQLTAIRCSATDSIIVGQPEFLVTAGELVKKVGVNDWKTYLRWKLITAAAPYLSDDIVNENFHFFRLCFERDKGIETKMEALATNN